MSFNRQTFVISPMLAGSLLVVILIGGGLYAYQQKQTASKAATTPSTTPTVIPAQNENTFTATDKGATASSTKVNFLLSFKIKGDASGQQLTPSQVRQEFTLTSDQLTAVKTFLAQYHLSLTGTPSTIMDVNGSASDVNSAFAITLHSFMRSDGLQFNATSTAPVVPQQIQVEVAGVIGLDEQGFLTKRQPL